MIYGRSVNKPGPKVSKPNVVDSFCRRFYKAREAKKKTFPFCDVFRQFVLLQTENFTSSPQKNEEREIPNQMEALSAHVRFVSRENMRNLIVYPFTCFDVDLFK